MAVYELPAGCVPTPLHSLLGHDSPELNLVLTIALARAEVIFAQDIMTRKVSLVYGHYLTELLKAAERLREQGWTIDIDEAPRKIAAIELDMDGDDLNRLLMLITETKGRHDYKPADA